MLVTYTADLRLNGFFRLAEPLMKLTFGRVARQGEGWSAGAARQACRGAEGRRRALVDREALGLGEGRYRLAR